MSQFGPLHPKDQYNRQLEKNVHPPDWANPKPSGRYNLVVIGAGTAGLVTAAGAAGLGAKVALIERELMGGDCLNVGCVPSKAIIRTSRAAAAVREAGVFGVKVPNGVEVDFAAAMERMRRLRARISPHDSAARFRALGIDVFFGQGTFSGPDRIEVGGETLRFSRAVIATGARAAAPSIPGLRAVRYLTNETVFSLTDLPRRLGVLGAGAIGCELAQAFARLGSSVFLIESMHGILPKEDPDAARALSKSFARDDITVLCCGRELQISKAGKDQIRLCVDSHGNHYDEVVDQLFIAVGRAPNVEDLGLAEAGVEYSKKGVEVNDRLRTTNRRIYAAGDICSPYQFTHAADFMARIVIQNALFMGRARVSALTIPWCTYTAPEVAHVGIYESEAKKRGVQMDTFMQALSGVDRAILDGDSEGFAKVHLRKGTDRILGATLVAANAGEMISEITLAMRNGIGLKGIGNTIHPYPTLSEVLRRLGDQFNRTRLTPLVKGLFKKWLSWTR